MTSTTQPSAIGRAFSWTQRESPLRRAAERGSELPAMKPATQANACRASTSELRNRIVQHVADVGGDVEPGERAIVGSATDTEAITQTASSSAQATTSAPPNQTRSTLQGRMFQRASAPRVSRVPWTSTRSSTFTTPSHRQAAEWPMKRRGPGAPAGPSVQS